MASNKRSTYIQISDNQREILQKYFREGGMTSTRKEVAPIIQKAAEETGLSEERIKKWISNEKTRLRKHGEPAADTVPAKKARLPSLKRGPSAYNVYCSQFLRSDECKGLQPDEKYKLAGQSWNKLPKKEVSNYRSMAEEQKKRDVDLSNLDEETKAKLIKTHKQQLLEQAYFLEDLGCESAILLLEDRSVSTGIDMGGSSEGSFFLRSNPSIYMKFAQHFSADCKHYTYKDVQELFNEKYSKAVGKTVKVPYEKGGFRVTNLPQGIDFKKPSSYGKKQVEQIMAARDNIHFEIVPDELQPSTVLPTHDLQPNPHLSHEVYSILSCIVGSENAKLASKTTPFGEEFVEVENLVLPQDYRLAMYSSCRDFFTPDAWLAIGANVQIKDPELPGVIIPVYTKSKTEKFWLFYTEDKLRRLEKITPGGSVTGFWLDVQPDDPSMYKLLTSPKDKVFGKSIIKSEHGPLYFFHHLNASSSDTQLFSMPVLLQRAIHNILTLSGMMQ